MESNKVVIPLKLPSLNEYINACRSNRYIGAKMKRDSQDQIAWFVRSLPTFEKPVRIRFTWQEKNAKRDLDNVAFAKKFILDSLVEQGKLKNDSQKYLIGFEDNFTTGKYYAVTVEILER